MGSLASVRSSNKRLTKWTESHPLGWCSLMGVLGTALMLVWLSVNFGGLTSTNLEYSLAFGMFFGLLQVLFLRRIET